MIDQHQLMLPAHGGEPFTDTTAASGGRPALYCTPRCRLRVWRSCKPRARS